MGRRPPDPLPEAIPFPAAARAAVSAVRNGESR